MAMTKFITLRFAAGLLAATALAGCGTAERLSRVGQNPAMSPVSSPTQHADYRPVTMPMPTPMLLEPAANSLWRPGARAFFKDQRAKQVGDVLTVVVNIQNERAQLSQQTSRTRNNSEGVSIPNVFGIGALQTDPGLDATSNSNSTGTGAIARSENINLRLAATILQLLPNGNMAVSGRQEVRVNGELRELLVAGVIRPEDIRADNTIAWDKIAEARVSYGGRGTITDVQSPRYGQQIFDILFPF
jgi:flagellar L-ring protein precursor FlgH